MQYVLKEKLISVGGKFTIRDGDGRETYLVSREMMTLGDKLSLQDLSGNELVYIEQKLANWGSSYEISRDGKLLAEVRRDLWSFRRHRFTIDVSGTDGLEAVGDFLNLEYFVKRGERSIARFTKQWFRLSDTWWIEIEDDQDHLLLLATAVVIEMICDYHKR